MKPISIFIIFLMSFSLKAQTPTEFPESKAEFIKVFKEFFTKSGKKQLKEDFKIFKANLTSGVITDDYFKDIHALSNKMLTKKMNATTFFAPYVKSINSLVKTEDVVNKWPIWNGILNQMFDDIQSKKTGDFKKILRFSSHLFDNNTIRYAKSGVNWLARNGAYEMKYTDRVPTLSFQSFDLLGARKKDTIRIYNTSGTYFPLKETWTGKNGVIKWKDEKVENAPDIHAEIGAYEINMKKPIVEVPKAKLYYDKYFPGKAIDGSLVHKVIITNKKGKSYPRFVSDNKNIEIKDFAKDITYTGGFKLQGFTIYGEGTDEFPAKILFERNGHTLYKGISDMFTLKETALVGSKVESVFYFGQDSIYHPSVNFKFDFNKDEISVNRGKSGTDRNPFYDSYHKIQINSNKLTWNLKNNEFIIGSKRISFSKTNKQKATFESFGYYNEMEYIRLQNVSNKNPVAIIKQVSEEMDSRTLDAEMLAEQINPNYSLASAKSLFYDLSEKGFINFSNKKKLVEVKDKVFRYANAGAEKEDYDILKILSKSDSINAKMTLSNKEMVVHGVKSLQFSTTQRVGISPFRSEIVIKQNRNIDYDGKTYGGFMVFEGKDNHFEYDPFKFVLDSIRYLDPFLPLGIDDKNGIPKSVSIKSRIEHLSGILSIDEPDNKSGKKEDTEYPIFKSTSTGQVFYDDKDIQGGIYHRDSFYFEVAPFEMKNIDQYVAEDLAFKGKMNSAFIFDEFDETLKLQKDTLLGFHHTTNTTNLYGGKGKYKGDVDLTSKGLTAKGNIKYLTTSIDSDDILFLPKEMFCSADVFILKEDKVGPPALPEVFGADVNIHWKPYKDSLYVKSEDGHFDIFKDKDHTLKGTIIVTPDGLNADGHFDWSKGTLDSKDFTFGSHQIYADTTNAKIKSLETDNFAFDTRNVKADVDYDTSLANFKANSDSTNTSMPYNQYITSMNEFTWDMEKQTIDFKTDPGKTGTFVSTHPDQDSLEFLGKTAFYDLNTNELRVGGVDIINSADAIIYTKDGKVEIKNEGIMEPLLGAKIIASVENKYHVINRSKVFVKGKKDYTASGYYQYDIGQKKQEILFENIIGGRVGKGKRSEKRVETRATGTVKEDENFLMDFKTKFKGEIKLFSNTPKLTFNGFGKIDMPLIPNMSWFSLNTVADKNNPLIKYDTPRNFEGQKLYTGWFLSREMARTYPRVMMPKYAAKDRHLLDVRGFMDYNPTTEDFVFADSARLTDQLVKGNKLILHKDGTIDGEGTFQLCEGMPNIDIQAAGIISTSLVQDSTNTEKAKVSLMVAIDLKLPKKLMKIIEADFRVDDINQKPVDYKKDEFYARTLPEFIDKREDCLNLITNMNAGNFAVPKKYLKSSFFFGRINMVWDPDYQSLLSVDSNNNIIAINNSNVNKDVKSYFEFKMPSNFEDRVHFLVTSPSDYFYFFSYKDGVLRTVSNNTTYTDAVIGLKKKERFVKTDTGKMEIQPINLDMAQQFIRRVETAKY